MNISLFNDNSVYGFKSDTISVSFELEELKGLDDFGTIDDESDILFYSYIVRVQVRNSNNESWRSLFDISTYDNSAILELKKILGIFIDNDLHLNNYQKYDMGHLGIHYQYSSPNFYLRDDIYSITHSYVLHNNGDIRQNYYSLSVGKPYKANNSDVLNVVFNKLSLDDLKVIYTCLTDFISNSIIKTNQQQKTINQNNMASWRIIDGKLYKYSLDGSSIENIYMIGDSLGCMRVLLGDLNSDSYHSLQCHNCILSTISEDTLSITKGYITTNEYDCNPLDGEKVIPFSSLISIEDAEPTSCLNFSESEIVLDFIGILTESEKLEFKNSSLSVLYFKWRNCLVNHYWLGREEHNLPVRVEGVNHIEDNINASVFAILRGVMSYV